MEIMEQIAPDLSLNCPKCHQKQQLIHKYENLISLLKKKAGRSSTSQLSQSQKLSIGDVTTSHASFNAVVIFNRYLLPLTLNKLQHKIKCSVLFQIKSQSLIRKSQKSQQFLHKLQKIYILKKKLCFNKLKLLSKDLRPQNILGSDSMLDNNQLIHQDTQINQTVIKEREKSENQANSPSIKRNGLIQFQNSITMDQWNYKSLACVHEDLMASVNKSSPKQESLPLLFSKKQSSSSQKIRTLYKNIFILEQQNYAYQVKIKNLQRHMEEASLRQIKENRKKTESLEMVAEEMAEKNELISELQEKITMLEEKYECEANGVLEDELTQHRKQVDKLEKVNIKLDNQLRKVRQKLIQSESSLKELKKQNSELTKENIKLKSSLFESEQKTLNFSTRQKNFQNSCQKIQQILFKLKLQQKSLSKTSRILTQAFPSNQDKTSLQQLYRLQLLFIFLYNIEDETFYFNENQHLFDEQQLEVLKQLKNKFIDMKQKLERKVVFMDSIQCADFEIKQANYQGFQRNLKEKNDVENIYCQQNMVDGSIFDVLDDHRQNVLQIESIPKNSERIEPEKNLTMKLLQMEIEKNKQIEKISELKEKNMYVRNIILNLMKSLELKQSMLKNQTSGILDLIFDVFQYSEEQKQIMFSQAQQSKEKRFFGFI